MSLVYFQIRSDKPSRVYNISYSNSSAIVESKQMEYLEQNWQEIPKISPGIEIYNTILDAIKEKIVDVSFDGFRVNLKDMKVGVPYFFSYDDSQYELIRNQKDDLEVFEIG